MKRSAPYLLALVALTSVTSTTCKQQTTLPAEPGITITETCHYDHDAGDEHARLYVDMLGAR